MTPLQKYIYVKAKNYHEEDYNKSTPSNVKQAHGALDRF